MAVQAEQQQPPPQLLLCDTTFPLQLGHGSANMSGNGLGWIGGGALSGDASRHYLLQQQEMLLMMGFHHPAFSNLRQTCLPQPQQYQASLTCDSLLLPQGFSSALALHEEKQKREIELLIQKQNECLRMTVQQHRQQFLSIAKIFEADASAQLKQKDAEIARSKKKSAELEEWLRRAEAETQTWQRLAKEHEAVALDLANSLEKVQQQNYHHHDSCLPLDVIPEASSCGSCSIPACEGEIKDAALEQRSRCKWCESRESCFLFLPCRHLCSCRTCERVLQSCPACGSAKQGAVEVLKA